MTKILIIFLLISTILRIAMGLLQKSRWDIKTYKYFIFVPVMSLVGAFGAKLASLIVYGSFDGTRLYGSVLATAMAAVIMAGLLKIKPSEMYGFNSLGTWLAVIVMKIPCVFQGCCGGRVLFINSNGQEVLFPSRLVEIVFAFVFFIWFIHLEKKGYLHSALYPLLMIWYGIYRYALDFMRGAAAEQAPFFLWIPGGRLFSLLILVIGLISMKIVLDKHNSKKNHKLRYIDCILGKVK